MADIKVKIGADASEFERAMNGMKSHMNKLAAISGGAILGFKAITSVASSAASAVASAGRAFVDFAQTASQKAAEMESLQVSFETLTGSAAKAKDLISEFRAEAQKSPLTTADYASAGKTLLAFGADADGLMGTLGILGDVSMGNSEKFKSLALAFAQTQAAGRLMGQEVLQFVNAGFNPLQVISQKTGLSMLELKKQMEAGAISSDMVAEAFKVATSEGGLFFNAIQRGAETMDGKMAQVRDSVDMLQISFGEGMNEGLKVALDAISNKLPEFYKQSSQIGVTLGNAIGGAVNGDADKFFKIGQFIGKLIKEGIKLSINTAGTGIAGAVVEGVTKYTPQGMTARALGFGEKLDTGVNTLQALGRMGNKMDARKTFSQLQTSFQNTFGYGDPNATVEGMRGTRFRYAQPGESSPFVDPATGFRLIEIMQRVADNTAPSGKAFP